jgi:DNA helicase-2/ATP-dependent DNA helicase PcrA
LLDFHKKEKGEKGLARIENLQELVSACQSFEPEENDQPLLNQFIDRAALDAGDNQAEEFEDAVQMMTLHSAKGLEFPVVFLAGVEENLFPHSMSLEEPGRLEEERRLCYVGITRAMEKLYITYAETRRLYGNEKFNTPSRFIREIPRDLIQEVRLRTEISRPSTLGGVSSNFQFAPDNQTGLQLGQRVTHEIFGEGIILNVEGNGARTRVQINFDMEGCKWLMLSHAKLMAI